MGLPEDLFQNINRTPGDRLSTSSVGPEALGALGVLGFQAQAARASRAIRMARNETALTLRAFNIRMGRSSG